MEGLPVILENTTGIAGIWVPRPVGPTDTLLPGFKIVITVTIKIAFEVFNHGVEPLLVADGFKFAAKLTQ